MLIRILLITLVATAVAGPASAQIYAWRDANGTLVLSDRKMNPDAAKIYDVPATSSFRSTRPVVSRAAHGQYEPLIQTHAASFAIPADLVRAVIQVESGFNPKARSPKGAMGLMQLMPQTAREMGVRDPYDAGENIRGGAGYLRQLLDKYEGNEELALAAYNAGPAAVDKYGQQVPPYRETRDYVKKVGSAASRQPLASARPAPVKRTTIYKIVEVIDGRPVSRYSTERPSSGDYQTIER